MNKTQMKNILGTTENLELFNRQGKKVYDFRANQLGLAYEYVYNEKGNELTYKDSNGVYQIKCKQVTKEEYEAFLNDTPTLEERLNKLEKKVDAMLTALIKATSK